MSEGDEGDAAQLADVNETTEVNLTSSAREETKAEADKRWQREGIADQVAAFREAARQEYRKANPRCRRDEARDYAWRRAMAEFPPPGVEVEPVPRAEPPEPEPEDEEAEDPEPPPAPEPAVAGLGAIPSSWPPLPPNASLAAEIQWVQASRIDVVEELPSGAVRVHLDRADRPAPSKAALGWLETSIRSFTKYCDIAAKATNQLDNEREHVRREKMAIEEIRSLLAEMVDVRPGEDPRPKRTESDHGSDQSDRSPPPSASWEDI